MPLFRRQKQVDPAQQWYEAYTKRSEVPPEIVYPLIRNALDQRRHMADLATVCLEKGRGLDVNNPVTQKQVLTAASEHVEQEHDKVRNALKALASVRLGTGDDDLPISRVHVSTEFYVMMQLKHVQRLSRAHQAYLEVDDRLHKQSMEEAEVFEKDAEGYRQELIRHLGELAEQRPDQYAVLGVTQV